MAKHKSLLAQLYAAHQRAKLEKQREEARARKAHAAEARKLQAQLDKEADQHRRAEERAAQARLRQKEQAKRARQQAATKAEREAASKAREQERQAVAQRRAVERERAQAERLQQQRAAEDGRAKIQRRMAEAEVSTRALQNQLHDLRSLLQHRSRNLVNANRAANDAFDHNVPDAFVNTLQQALATSVYPDGLRGSCAALFRPEARELLVEYELPRQDTIPPVAGYRYIKNKDLIQAEPRKETEIKRLYADLLARTTLRTWQKLSQ